MAAVVHASQSSTAPSLQLNMSGSQKRLSASICLTIDRLNVHKSVRVPADNFASSVIYVLLWNICLSNQL